MWRNCCYKIILLILAISSTVYADKRSSFLALKLGLSAEKSAFADSGAGFITDDVTFVYTNPALVAELAKKFQLITSHTNYLRGIKYEHWGVNLPTKLTNIGINILYLYKDKIKVILEDAKEVESDFSIHDAICSISVGKKHTDFIDIGFSLKFFQEKLEKEIAFGFAVDFGLLYKNFWEIKDLNLGAALHNIGSSIKFIKEENLLPLNIRLGLTYKLWEDTLVYNIDLDKPIDDDFSIKTGIRFKLFDKLSLILGYRKDKEIGLPLTLGIIINLKRLRFCYAFEEYSHLGTTHRLSIKIF
jgi:hypothetical protein